MLLASIGAPGSGRHGRAYEDPCQSSARWQAASIVPPVGVPQRKCRQFLAQFAELLDGYPNRRAQQSASVPPLRGLETSAPQPLLGPRELMVEESLRRGLRRE